MTDIYGGDADSLYFSPGGAICFPDNAIWPNPSVIVAPEDATEEEQLLLEQQVTIALTYAWTSLQLLSAYQIAICPVTVRPCKPACAGGSYFVAPVTGPAGSPFWPTVRNGQWLNIWCGHQSSCECVAVEELVLPGPVGAIVEVRIDGTALDPSAYRVDNGNHLVRHDGGKWPACQDFNLPAGEDGTFTVTYYHGSTADILVRYAAGVLATEWLAALQNRDCRLPAGTTAIVRQGITIEVNTGLFVDGKTGIPEVDTVLDRYNPYALRTPPGVYSRDRLPARGTTWAPPEAS